MKRLTLTLRACLLGGLLGSSNIPAATTASDSQSDSSYATWDPGDNGGSGWGGGWTFRNQANVVLTTTSGSRGCFVGSSLGNNNPAGSDGNGDGDINSLSTVKAWGLYSNSGDQVYAIRPFNGALSIGQTLMWDMDNGNIASGQVVGLRLLGDPNDINSRIFEARFVGGDSFYTLVGAPNQATAVPFTREGLHFEYTLTSASTFSLSIERLSDGSISTYSGANVNGNSIMALAFKNQFAGSGAAADGYLNNLAIIPEPGTMALVGLGAVMLIRRGRRR
jgi:hypothetical protein